MNINALSDICDVVKRHFFTTTVLSSGCDTQAASLMQEIAGEQNPHQSTAQFNRRETWG